MLFQYETWCEWHYSTYIVKLWYLWMSEQVDEKETMKIKNDVMSTLNAEEFTPFWIVVI